MNALVVKKCALAEVIDAPEFPQLAAEYEAECAMPGMPSPIVKMAIYQQLEAAGALTPIGAWMNDRLIGFIGILYHTLPHYGVGLAVSESFFVRKAYRSTGAGIKLKQLGEEVARALGSSGLLITAPVGSSLDAMLSMSVKYRPASNAYFRSFE